MLTLYARLEPTTDGSTFDMLRTSPHLADPLRMRDVVLYKDRDATKFASRHPWHYQSKPDQRNKYVMHNCHKYLLQWLDPLPLKPKHLMLEEATAVLITVDYGLVTGRRVKAEYTDYEQAVLGIKRMANESYTVLNVDIRYGPNVLPKRFQKKAV